MLARAAPPPKCWSSVCAPAHVHPAAALLWQVARIQLYESLYLPWTKKPKDLAVRNFFKALLANSISSFCP